MESYYIEGLRYDGTVLCRYEQPTRDIAIARARSLLYSAFFEGYTTQVVCGAETVWRSTDGSGDPDEADLGARAAKILSQGDEGVLILQDLEEETGTRIRKRRMRRRR